MEQQAEKCLTIVNQIIQVMERLIESGEETADRVIQALEQVEKKMEGMADYTVQAIEQLGEKEDSMTERMVQTLEQLAEKEVTDMTNRIIQVVKQLAEKGEEISFLLEREEQCCVSVVEQMNAIEVLSKITSNKMQTLVEDHYNKLNDLFDDQNDNLNDCLETMKKEQLRLLREYGEMMNERVKELNQVVSSGVNPVLEQNQELLKYVQEVQKEWTSLDKKELDFLSKVWEGR